MMRDQRRDGGLGASMQVSLGDADAYGRPIVVAAKHEGAAGGQDNEVAVGVMCLRTVLTERRDRDIDQGRVDRRDIGIAESTLGKRAGGVRLDEEVRARDEAPQDRLPVVGVEIQRDAPLVAVVGPPVQRAVGMRVVLIKRPEPPSRRSARWLHLDHVGTEVAQDLAAEQAALGGEVEHTVGTQHRPPPL
jgi:hypothetical protein